MYIHDSIRSEAVRFDGLNPPPKSPYVKNPKFTKHSGFHKFNSPVLSDVEKFTEFNGTIFLNIFFVTAYCNQFSL